MDLRVGKNLRKGLATFCAKLLNITIGDWYTWNTLGNFDTTTANYKESISASSLTYDISASWIKFLKQQSVTNKVMT